MAEPDQRDAALLLDMKLAAADALSFVKGLDRMAFLGSPLYQSAVMRKLEIIGEAANKISAEFKGTHPEILWREIIATRNRLIHGYADVQLDYVWSVLQDDLEPLISALEPLIPPPGSS